MVYKEYKSLIVTENDSLFLNLDFCTNGLRFAECFGLNTKEKLLYSASLTIEYDTERDMTSKHAQLITQKEEENLRLHSPMPVLAPTTSITEPGK